MCSDGIKEENGQYIVEDSTSGGYVDRMTHSLSQHWTSVWDKDLNFISLKNQYYDLTDALNTKNKNQDDYHKGVRAKNRHLKMLKDCLGIHYTEKKVEKKVEDLIYLERSPYTKLDSLNRSSCIIHDKTVDISGGYKRFAKHNLYMTPHTPDKELLMNEYNRKLEEFKEFREYIFNQLFGK